MLHKPILRFVITPIAVAGILMLAILAATANATEDDNAGTLSGGETQAPPAGALPTNEGSAGEGETAATEDPLAGDGETTEAPPPTTETPPPAAPPTTETPPPAAPPAGASQGGNNTDFVNTILEIVNRERAAVGVPPLVWSDTLAAGAQAWADHLVTINNVVHSPGNFKDYGETIAWRGPSGGTLIPMVESWVAEKTLYHGGPMPADGGGFSHYTQLVWRTTTEIGCGMASGINDAIGSIDYLVCRFLPMGNFVGQSPYG
jgi:hypothetical protein